ncbi:hypothetical protein J1605_022003 [Eschrichtius robustus]|uniref:Up-regulated during skeletal muscle growth protein 5 n=10 Tax=Cetacea TaxID=9721 RepID=A0AB34H9J3_ESCRO|nr:hypothetical protein J1605_022003 [Eschrichtius robustus]
MEKKLEKMRAGREGSDSGWEALVRGRCPVRHNSSTEKQKVARVVSEVPILQIEIMAGPETDAQYQFTGIKKYFNSYTLTGRMNCVLATYGGIALIVLYFKLRSKKTPAVKAT